MRNVHRVRAVRGFSLVELLVVIGIIAVLIGILLPVMSRVREASKRAACLSNLRSIGQSLYLYANAHKDLLPNGNPPGSWDDAAGQSQVMVEFHNQYVKGAGVFHCPSDSDPTPTKIITADRNTNDSARISYEFFFLWWPPETPARLAKMKKDGLMAPLGWDHFGGDPVTPVDAPDDVSRNHLRGGKTIGGNVLFSDGHAEWQDAKLWDDYSWPAPARKVYPWPS